MRWVLVIALLICSSAYGSDANIPACQVTAETGLQGFDESKETPFTEVHIMSAQGDQCPSNYKDAIYRATQSLALSRFTADVSEGTVLSSTNEPVHFLSWTNVKTVGDVIESGADFTTTAP